jgi:hypothetical protein
MKVQESLNVVMIVEKLKVETVVKGMFIVGLLMYCVFAMVVLKQTSVMGQTIEGKYNQAIKLFAWLHMFMAILLVAAAVAVL